MAYWLFKSEPEMLGPFSRCRWSAGTGGEHLDGVAQSSDPRSQMMAMKARRSARILSTIPISDKEIVGMRRSDRARNFLRAESQRSEVGRLSAHGRISRRSRPKKTVRLSAPRRSRSSRFWAEMARCAKSNPASSVHCRRHGSGMGRSCLNFFFLFFCWRNGRDGAEAGSFRRKQPPPCFTARSSRPAHADHHAASPQPRSGRATMRRTRPAGRCAQTDVGAHAVQ